MGDVNLATCRTYERKDSACHSDGTNFVCGNRGAITVNDNVSATPDVSQWKVTFGPLQWTGKSAFTERANICLVEPDGVESALRQVSKRFTLDGSLDENLVEHWEDLYNTNPQFQEDHVIEQLLFLTKSPHQTRVDTLKAIEVLLGQYETEVASTGGK